MTLSSRKLLGWAWLQVARVTGLLILATVLTAGLVWLAPGLDVDARALDPRLNQEVLAQHQLPGESPIAFAVAWLKGLVRGDLGYSSAFNYPIRDLLTQRLPVTAKNVALGLSLGLGLGWVSAAVSAVRRGRVPDLVASLAAGTLLAMPAAVLGLLVVQMRWSTACALAAAVFPRAYRYTRNLLVDALRMPHLTLGRALGLAPLRLWIDYVIRPVLPQLLFIVAVSLNLAFAASVPVEVVCDSPGLGRLAWEAALARDLPLLATLTVLIAVATGAATGLASLSTSQQRGLLV